MMATKRVTMPPKIAAANVSQGPSCPNHRPWFAGGGWAIAFAHERLISKVLAVIKEPQTSDDMESEDVAPIF
jgi:hypothetical protein